MNILNYGIAALLTLMVFSYLLGNNPLYRLVQHLFVGVSLGYATLLLLGNLVFIQIPTFSTQEGLGGWLYGLPLLFGLVLLMRLIRPAVTAGDGAVFRLLVPLSTLVMNVAVSTAAALALGGALKGTLLSQVAAGVRPIGGDVAALLGGIVLLIGTVAALHYFRFTLGPAGRRSPLGAGVASAGRWFILIGLGATLGSLSVSFVQALISRLDFLLTPPF
jgi:hypothetical protein